jgi:hypothetical protein
MEEIATSILWKKKAFGHIAFRPIFARSNIFILVTGILGVSGY